ncbi:MAG TPA: hypothetical protein VGI92_03770 [Gemmatimonadales bacterium]|jgi:hypothetical protein
MRLWELLAILVAWAAIVSVRRRAGRRSMPTPQTPGGSQGKSSPHILAHDPDIDYDELEQAEKEVKDLDTDAKGRPLDDVIGDDWGPGTPKPPYT